MVCVMRYKKTGKMLGKNLEEVKKGRKYNVAAPNGSLICPIWFKKIKPYVDGIAVVQGKKNIFSRTQWGILDIYGIVTWISGEYENVIALTRNLIAVQEKVKKGQKGAWGLVDKNNIVICKPKYDKCPEWIIKGEFLMAQVCCQITILDNAGRQLCKPQYTSLRNAYRDERESGIICEGIRNGYWYKINNKGVELKTGYHESARVIKTGKRYY